MLFIQSFPFFLSFKDLLPPALTLPADHRQTMPGAMHIDLTDGREAADL